MGGVNSGRPTSPWGVSIDLVLDAQGAIQRMASAERERTEDWYEKRKQEIERRRYEDTEAEMRRHRSALDKIRRRYQQDMTQAEAMHQEFVHNIDVTRDAISDYERKVAAQLSVVGYPRQATAELVQLAIGG